MKGKNIAIGIGVLLIVGALGSNGQQERLHALDVQDNGLASCQSAVKAQLTSPATASFTGTDVMTYVIDGTVSSQNAFGATLSSTYACQLDGNGHLTDTPILVAH